MNAREDDEDARRAHPPSWLFSCNSRLEPHIGASLMFLGSVKDGDDGAGV